MPRERGIGKKPVKNMISFDDFKAEAGIPIYMQILLHIKRGVVAGTVRDNDELPSRRVLSALLGANPNTIQKAFRILEEEELIQSRSGAKSYMTLDSEKTRRVRDELIENDAGMLIRSIKQMGFTKDEAIALIEKYWSAEETNL